MKARMVPLGPVFRRYVRTVRDVAVASGKLARLVVEGDDVEVDTSVVEAIRDPLTHMVRNAVDHGIESPRSASRGRQGPAGVVTLRARTSRRQHRDRGLRRRAWPRPRRAS